MSDKPPLPSDSRTRREAELAEALRANLKRRKAQPGVDSKGAQKGAHADEKEESERADPPLPPPPRDG